ncbi:DUF6452 family protein [Ochrovirga pacifica]|uniref:DUF6452 family protein n=1 Tax=Ochrovirga pacifica TaxID=1042376 RepID=UPI0002559B39|nr:DUF6452 family protein [Ochrovirga pacifica]
MKKNFLIFFSLGLILTFFSCQDEFCLEPTTPQLVLRFYDKDTLENNKAISLVAWVGNDTIPTVIGNASDSIALPINTQANSVTYQFSIFDSVPSLETFTLNYTVEDVYVSKACGYKSVFTNVSITHSSDNWLSSSKLITSEISNENQAHVQIYH